MLLMALPPPGGRTSALYPPPAEATLTDASRATSRNGADMRRMADLPPFCVVLERPTAIIASPRFRTPNCGAEQNASPDPRTVADKQHGAGTEAALLRAKLPRRTRRHLMCRAPQ